MRISDWSSDVCSSDLYFAIVKQLILKGQLRQELNFLFTGSAKLWAARLSDKLRQADFVSTILEKAYTPKPKELNKNKGTRSEEHRVRKECVSTVKSRWSPLH